jgi:two-component system chemotaxis response regulator CheB
VSSDADARDATAALARTAERLVDTVKAAARAHVVARAAPAEAQPTSAAQHRAVPLSRIGLVRGSTALIAIGASTGGTEALLEVLRVLPEDCPGVVVVQHMPERFTRHFAERLDGLCTVRVKEAAHGDPIQRGHVLIAPGDHHLTVARGASGLVVRVERSPPVNRHRPSVDVLFDACARVVGSRAVGVILTGMGDDGARGLKALRDAGAHTIAQDEASCVVFGMPREAIARGGAVEVLPLDAIARAVVAHVGGAKSAKGAA